MEISLDRFIPCRPLESLQGKFEAVTKNVSDEELLIEARNKLIGAEMLPNQSSGLPEIQNDLQNLRD